MKTRALNGDKVAFRPAEVQASYGISKTKVFALIKDGTLRTVKVGKARLILRSSLDALLAEAA